MRGLRSVVVGCGAVGALLLTAGCGSSAAPAHSAPPAKGKGVSAQSVEHALVNLRNPPRPTMVSCRTAAAREVAAIFGSKPGPLFICELTLTGERASYVVQVLPNGCFVAERRRRGRAVYGCGAERT